MKRNAENNAGKKKLTVKREVIRSLTNAEIKGVNGGHSGMACTQTDGCSESHSGSSPTTE
jgi:hypothetical protein